MVVLICSCGFIQVAIRSPEVRVFPVAEDAVVVVRERGGVLDAVRVVGELRFAVGSAFAFHAHRVTFSPEPRQQKFPPK